MCSHFTRPGDTVFIEEPTYFLAHQIFTDHGLELVGIPMDGQGMRMDAFEEALQHHRPRLVYTIPSYHNPTGVTLSGERRRRLAELSRRHDFIIAADEVYQLLNYLDQPPPAMGTLCQQGNVLSLGSFSKIMAPALRLGWIQASPALMDHIMTIGFVNSGGSINHFTSQVMREAIDMGLQQALLEELRDAYRRRLTAMDEALHQHLDGLATWQRPGGGYFFWLELTGNADATALKSRAAEFKTGFQPGPVFSCGDGFQAFLRLSFAHYRSDEIRAGISRLGRLLKENRGIN